jgi:hypothetical protein
MFPCVSFRTSICTLGVTWFWSVWRSGKTKGYSIFQALLVCFQKHNLELSKLVGIFSYGAPYVVGSKYGMILLYKHIHEFGLQNEYLQYHCIIHQHHIMGNALECNGPWPMLYAREIIPILFRVPWRSWKWIWWNCDYSEVHWISRGNFLYGFLSLLEEIKFSLLQERIIVQSLYKIQAA